MNFKNMQKKYWYLVLGAVILLAAGAFLVVYNWTTIWSPIRGIINPGSRTITIPSGINFETTTVITSGEEGGGMMISLSEGNPQPQRALPVSYIEGDPLTEEEINRILQRLPAVSTGSEDQVDFRLAQEPIPPPRTGETVTESFPSEDELVPPDQLQPDAGPLRVLRYSPEGEIAIAPFLSVTFNQPMVPLATVEALQAADVPVQIEPALVGTWRWLGTKTLTFEYDSDLIDRFPKATRYTAIIPAGTKSATGGILDAPVEWSFSTPPPKVIKWHPSDIPQPLEPIIFLAFDQRISPEAVLKTIQVTAEGKDIGLRLASEEEIQAEAHVRRLVKNMLPDRWLALRPQEPLPPSTTVQVRVGPGTPSAEGPLVTTETKGFSFHTYDPLRIDDHGCSWGNEQCRPLTPFFIRFNNLIDSLKFQEEFLTISPELPDATVNLFGNTLEIRGATQARTTYTVDLSKEIEDIFEQQLGNDVSLNFRVGEAEPRLFGSEQYFVTLDPSLEKPAYSVYAVNMSRLEVQIYAVQPTDWSAFHTYLREWRRENSQTTPPGRKVFDGTLNVENAGDTLAELAIDLNQYMDGEYGHFIVVVQPPRGVLDDDRDRVWQTVQTWVQITRIGLDAFNDHSEMVAWASSLQDGAPLVGVTVAPGNGGATALTDDAGVALLSIPDGARYLVARKGADTAILPSSPYFWDEYGWQSYEVGDELRWYVFDDRQMYRPGEEVHFKGWLRKVGGEQDGDVGLVGGVVDSVHYTITGSQGNVLDDGQAELNALGGFDFVFAIPESVNLGYTQVMFQASGLFGNLSNLEHYHAFQIQEFRRPEFEVIARNESSGPYFAGEGAVFAVEAKYYAGDPLPNAEVTWLVTSSPSNYSPPNWPDFNFGKWQPWWGGYRYDVEEGIYIEYGDEFAEAFDGLTDASGNHYLRLDFNRFSERPDNVPGPYSVLAEATVMDVNRQAWSSTTSLLVHPADLYVGLRSAQYFVERGTPVDIDLIVTDLDGNPVEDRQVTVTAARLEWKYEGGSWRQLEADTQTCTVGSTLEPVRCTFETEVGGEYRITATVSDSQGRQNQSQLTRWVSGGQRPLSRKVEQEQVMLIPDQESYQPGDIARVLVQAPFENAEGLLTVSRNGILYTQRFTIQGSDHTLEIPIEDAYIPNLSIQVDLVGAAPRTDPGGEIIPGIPPRPAYASGQLTLSIPPMSRTLALQILPQETELEPGDETVIDLSLKDASGKPVPGAELAVVVVDEAILALSNYQMVDPLSVFYSGRPSIVESRYSRASLVLADPLALAGTGDVMDKAVEVQEEAMMEMEAPAMEPMPTAEAGGRGLDEASPEPIRMRTDFNPLATFAPEVRTDSNGEAQVTVKLPDNITRYRVMVVAVDEGKQFGIGEANLTARLPVMVRPSAPRFLNFGDRFELPIVLQNQTGESRQVDVVARASNLKFLGDGSIDQTSTGQSVQIPAHDRIEIRFPAETDRAGEVTIQFAVVSGDFADAITIELPVYTPATTEAFATYGVVDEGAVFQPVASPTGVFPQYGGLEIQTSSTALQALTDAVLYLVTYPYECSEQLASRILAIAALRDVLSAFDAEGLPSPKELEQAVVGDIERLEGMQNDDGGFPYWQRGWDSIPFNTIHVAHALQRAEMMGFSVPTSMKQNALEYLRQIESHYPHWYSQRTRQTLSAYALYVRHLSGDRDVEKAQRLIDDARLENLSLDAVGWLWQVLQDSAAMDDLEAIRTLIGNRVVETAGAANFTTDYDETVSGEENYLLLGSNRRTDAILLDALIGDDPASDLIPKLVNGLLAHRTKGRWYNTQENVFVLLAMDRYFDTYESQEPDFVARIWLGETYAGEHTYQGYTTEQHETKVPMVYLVDESLGGGEQQDLVISKDGAGRLYYRLGLRYAPMDLLLDPLDMGFTVQRIYEAVDDPADVSRDEQGRWHIKAGSRVRVRIKMVADNRRYHVALADPLPAGLEIINPALAVSGSVPADPNSQERSYGWWWWSWTWYEHQNLRDERAEAFTPLLWDGVYEYTYLARATTPGTFIAPPTKAEEMYSPEVFGRSGSDWVIVE